MNVFINGVPFHTRRSVLPWLSTIVVCWCLHTHRNSKAWIGGVVDLMSNRKGRERDGEWQAAKSHKSESNPVPLQQGLRLCTWGTCSTGRATRTPPLETKVLSAHNSVSPEKSPQEQTHRLSVRLWCEHSRRRRCGKDELEANTFYVFMSQNHDPEIHGTK